MNNFGNVSIKEKFRASLLLSAAGDALGWPFEFRKWSSAKRNESFFKWSKTVGGKWWGYREEVLAGEYSDDTQLMLAVARSLKSNGEFDTNYFSYLELPFWLTYERGGGRSIKLAAKNLTKKKTYWYNNFYKSGELEYAGAGANGAAMRILPIALVNIDNEQRLLIDTFKNAIITHGHPRGIIGALVLAFAQRFFLANSQSANFRDFLFYIQEMLNASYALVENPAENEEIFLWLKKFKDKYGIEYHPQFKNYIKEMMEFIIKIPDYIGKKEEDYYSFTGADTKEFKGSGISTVCVAIFLVFKYLSINPKNALIIAANYVGSDTDTIANFVGSLIGCCFGFFNDSVLNRLIEDVQDREYLIKIADSLLDIYRGKKQRIEFGNRVEKKESIGKLLEWEKVLEKLFKEKFEENSRVVFPVFGEGVVEFKKIERIIRKEGYFVKIARVKFNMGQTVYFHFREK